LKKKLLEEVNEYLFGEGDDELQDIIDVCQAIQGKKDKYSEGWILEDKYSH